MSSSTRPLYTKPRMQGIKIANSRLGLPQSFNLVTYDALSKNASELEAPNYGPSSSENTSCKTCKHYNKLDDTIGHCSKYNFTAQEDYTCDGWESAKTRAPSQFIRTKLR